MSGFEIVAIVFIILISILYTVSKSQRNSSSSINQLKKSESKAEPKSKLEPDDDYENFDSFFSQIRRDLTTENDHRLVSVMKRIDKVLMHTVGDGKKFRAMMTVKCLKDLVPPEMMTTELSEMSYAVGWSLELTQAAYLVYDDIMDNSLTRRGKQCWYLYKNNGVLAINDGSLMRLIIDKILKKYCSNHPCYLEILGLFKETSRNTMLGQIMDAFTTPDGKRPDFTLLNETRYETIVKYKTSLYTFVTPFRLAMYLANITDANMHADAETLFLRIGHLFQAQDDYLDIYGDPNVTGKVGTDIEDGKCSLIAVNAYKAMDPKTKKIFEQNYGRKERVNAIKTIFESLNMQTVFKTYDENELTAIRNMVSNFGETHNVCMKSVNSALNKLSNRKK